MTELILAGFGGQGVLTAGLLLISAGMKKGNNVTFYPSYGAEMRGGTANCSVKISQKKIASPMVKEPDILFTLNEPAIDRFERSIKPGGVLLVNSSLVKADRKYRDDIKVYKVPVTDIANELNNPRAANVAMLGVLAAKTGLFDADYLIEQINEYFEGRGRKVPANEQVYRKAMDVVK